MSSSIPSLNPPKRLLFGPGPSPVAARVYEAMAKPIVGHLDPFFFEINEEIRPWLQMVFGTKNPFTMVLSGTGSAGMEAAVSNFVEDGTKFLVFISGFFAERIAEMGRRQGATVIRCEKPWGQNFTDDEMREAILREKPQVVGYVTAETSTGVWQNGKALCEAAHEVGALVIADCVTSLGTMPINIDDTGIDIAFSCSQKGLSCPPGLSPITVSERAMEKMRARTSLNHTWYLDFKLLDEYFGGQKRYHHTAPISMFYALREGLALIAEEGLAARFVRHQTNHKALIAGLEGLGLSMLVNDPHRLWTLHTPLIPEGKDDMTVRKSMLTNYSIDIAGGFGPLAGKIWRIGLMGEGSKTENVALIVEALGKALA